MKEEYLSIDTITRLVELEKENKELQDKIDKAIEYIEKDIIYDTMQPNRKVLILPNELLEILRGEDNVKD